MHDPSATPAPPQPDPLAYPSAATLPAAVAVIATLQSAATDAADLAVHPRLGEAQARICARLAEELSEADAMIRSLPQRPAPMSGHDYALLTALRTAHAAGEDIGETVARALVRLAAEVGGTAAVIANQPGSWEAAHIVGLLSGTVGEDPVSGPAS